MAASGAKAEASVLGPMRRCCRLFARRTLDAPASEVKAEAAVGKGLFTRHTLDADASEVKAEAPAVGTVLRAKCFCVRISLERSLRLALVVVGTAQVVSKAQEDTKIKKTRAVGKERKQSLA